MRREAMVERARSDGPFDVAIVGGGATGLGSALDAALRGYRTIVLDAGDFAHGTSSRSTKLIHGGVRYLARGEIGLVREALRERGILLRNAPHLVRPLAFVVPAYSFWAKPYYGLGLWLYDRLAGRSSLRGSRMVGRDEALRLAPTLRPDGLRGGVVYEDAQFDDARLAVALARTAANAGAVVANYLRAVAIEKVGGRIGGLIVRDEETGETFPIAAKVVINAAGVFADAVRRLDDPDAEPVLRPSRGSHVVLPRAALPGDAAVLVPKTDDGRVLFAIPWLGRVLIGTTDVPVEAASDDPRPTGEEVDYLLRHASRYLDAPLGQGDVLARFAGLRPLVAAKGATTKALSREHALLASPSGLVTITGGKWTTYRRMADDAVTLAAKVGALPSRPCATEAHPLDGSRGEGDEEIRELIAERPEWSSKMADGFPNPVAEAVRAVRHEMARTVADVLARRTRLAMLDSRAAVEAAPMVAEVIASELGRDSVWRAEAVAAFRRSMERA